MIRDLTPTEAGCLGAAGLICRATPGFVLAAGAASWSVRATNAYGDGPWSGSMDFVVLGNARPTVAIVMPTSATTYSTGTATLALSGTATDDLGVTQVSWATDKGASGVATGTSSWSVPSIPLRFGSTVTITVTARDAAGNTATDSITVTVLDNVAPTVAISRPPSLLTPSPSAALSGTAADEFGLSQVTWSNSRGGSGIAAGTTSWTVAGIPLQAGANIITITARDSAGLTASDSVTVTRTDSDAPTVSVVTPTSSATYATNVQTVTLAGTSTDPGGVAAVTWSNSQGGGGTAVGTTSWSVPGVTLAPGVNVITVLARDTFGNTGRTQLAITATDNRAPVVTILSNGPSVAADAIQISGTATDDFGLASVSWRNSRGGSGLAVGTTSWIAASVPVQPGSNDITITATDKAGNSATSVLKINGNKVKSPASTTTAAADLSGVLPRPLASCRCCPSSRCRRPSRRGRFRSSPGLPFCRPSSTNPGRRPRAPYR